MAADMSPVRIWIRGKLMLASLYVQAFISWLSPKYKGPTLFEAQVWAMWNQHTSWPPVEPTQEELEAYAYREAKRKQQGKI